MNSFWVLSQKVASKCLSILLILTLMLIAIPINQAQAAVSIDEPFTGNSATGWVLSGDAVLTGDGAIDPVGQGWLRLTSNSGNQAGAAIYNTAFSSSDGIEVEFSYATYGGTGADGFTFYLIDGSTVTPTLGGNGGALGYSWIDNAPAGSPNTAGVTNGYVAIGFDEFGGFALSNVGSCDITTCGYEPNNITIRGSGSLLGYPGFQLLATEDVPSISTGSRAGAHRVRITIAPGGTSITVAMDSGSGFVTYVNAVPLATATDQVALPATMKMGFSGSTGGSTNYHEIRGITVKGSRQTTLTLTSSLNSAPYGSPVTFTATVDSGPGGGVPGGSVTFYDGTTALLNVALSAYGGTSSRATYTTTMLSSGTHPITAEYSGSSVYGASLSSNLNQVIDPYTPPVNPVIPESDNSNILPKTGFRPDFTGTVTERPAASYPLISGKLTLTIPKINVQTEIIGVPSDKNTWDVSWLGNNVGWLSNTAYPTWVGNSVITGHVWSALNTPGPFVDLKNLTYGDQFQINDGSQTYTYEVRENKKISSDAIPTVFKHIKDYSWVTLLTCEDYVKGSETYSSRRMVRAILVAVE